MQATGHNGRRPACTRTARITIGYTLSAAATVTFKITGRLPGRKVGGRCVAQTPENGGRRRCTRRAMVHGSTVQKGNAGANHLVLSRKLAPGTYTLTATPTGGTAEQVTYRIVG